jgi:protocatechuate 3,4-dioxygenase beta subunit
MTSSVAKTRVTIAPSASTVSGLVTTSTGTPISGAAVTLGISDTFGNRVVKYLAYTNATGNYTFSGVKPTTYTLKAVKSGVTFPAPVSIPVVSGSNPQSPIAATNP